MFYPYVLFSNGRAWRSPEEAVFGNGKTKRLDGVLVQADRAEQDRRLSGTYEHVGGSSRAVEHPGAAGWGRRIAFRSDGAYEVYRRGASVPSERGRCRIDGWTITLRNESGQPGRAFFYSYSDGKGLSIGRGAYVRKRR